MTHTVKAHYRTFRGKRKLVKEHKRKDPVMPPRAVKQMPKQTKQVKGVPYKEVWISTDDLEKGTTVRINFKDQTVTIL